MSRIVCDSCFVIGLVNTEDQYHELACTHFDTYCKEGNLLLIPYPSMYEYVNERIGQNPHAKFLLKKFLENMCVKRISDNSYRYEALEMSLNLTNSQSLVDTIINLMISRSYENINGLISYNIEDFEVVCGQNGVTLIH